MNKLLSVVFGSLTALLANEAHVRLALETAAPAPHGPLLVTPVNGVATAVTWPQGLRVPFRFTNNLGSPATMPPNIVVGSDPRNAFKGAAKAWSAAGNISFLDAGLTAQTLIGQDGVNLVTFSDPGVPAGVIAETFVFWSLVTGRILEADIRFSMALQHDTTQTNPAAFDIQSIATHELGHAFGLEHSPIVAATMFPIAGPQSIGGRVLSQDDIAGINRLYPTVAFFNATGAISGAITSGGAPVAGAHVFARDVVSGATVAGAISSATGTYTITGLPAGGYSLTAEPLDGPFFAVNVAGNTLPAPINTAFNVPVAVNVNVVNATVATANLVAMAGAAASIDFANLVPLGGVPSAPLNLPVTAARPPVGTLNYSLTIQGAGITTATTLAVSGPGVFVGPPMAGLPGAVQYTVSVDTNAAPGAHDLVVTNGPAPGTVFYCGGFDILDSSPPRPQVIRYGTGCMSTVNNVALQLNPTGQPQIGSTFFLTMLPLAATELPVLSMSLFTSMGPTAPCQLTLIDTSPTALLPAPNGVQVGTLGGNVGGAQTWSWVIPNSASLSGFTVNVQAFAFVGGLPGGSSNALRLVVR